MKYIYSYNIIFGEYSIVEDEDKIVGVFSKGTREFKDAIERETELIRETYRQLEEYLGARRKVFDLPLNPEGTDFQKLVWKELLNIAYGETRSYKEIAQAIGRDKAFRAVGNANNKNPIGIIIPCHRVIGSDGKMVGYANGLDMKLELLELEKKYK